MTRSWFALLLVGLAGCFGPHEEKKVRPSDETRPPVKLRPITADMVTPENANRRAEQLFEILDKEDEGAKK
ncbi:MAG: hypothetical protein U0793_26650 [Gemmataceae bacterium]